MKAFWRQHTYTQFVISLNDFPSFYVFSHTHTHVHVYDDNRCGYAGSGDICGWWTDREGGHQHGRDL